MEHRIRIYQSALNGVTYVYGKPVRFSADHVGQRSQDFIRKVLAAR